MRSGARSNVSLGELSIAVASQSCHKKRADAVLPTPTGPNRQRIGVRRG
jgi:hypothetical protein